jgi:hypothetical protein
MRTARFLDGSEHPLAQRKSGIGEHKASRVSNHTETHALKVGVRGETVISTRAGSSLVGMCWFGGLHIRVKAKV